MPPFTMVACSAATVLGTLAVTPLPAPARMLVAAGTAALCAFALFYPRTPGAFRVLLLVALAGACGNAAWRQRASPVSYEHRTARYGATMLDRADQGDGSSALIAALDDGTRVLARVRGQIPPIGARVVIRGRLASFDDARNPDEPSERVLEQERGFDARLEAATILATRPGAPWNLQAWLARAHEWAHAQLRRDLGEPDASVVAGELWGERSALPPDLRNEFQETGTVHVLVTAGLHLGAVAALALAVLSLFAIPRGLTCAVAIALVWVFVWWSGGQLPAVRAATMVTAALGARACGRATFSWNALALAALVVTFARPESVATASFALSFSCVGAIFTCAVPLERRLEAHIALPHRFREAVVLSLATQIGTWPLTAAIFLQFAPYAIAANLAVVPCVAVTMGLGAAELALAWCPPLALACAHMNSWPLAWMLAVVRALSSLPAAAIVMTPAPAWCIAAYDAAVLAAPFLWRLQAAVALAALLVTAGWVLWPPRTDDTHLRITVLDVGQADAIVVQTPRGHTLLIDAGGRLERGPQVNGSIAERVGERIVVPFLLRHGIHRIDALIVSHPHGDHAGGAAPVERRLVVTEFADSGQIYGGHAYHDAIDAAHSKRIPIVYPRAGMQWRTDDGITLSFIGPSLPFIGGSNAINSNSIAFMLRYGRFRMLFTGDAGGESESRFLSEHVDLHADVLKVGHHGSAYGSTPAFIAAVHPAYALISVGRHNLFGHPAPRTLATLQRYGARTYRTDENGAITIATDGTHLTVVPMLAPPSLDTPSLPE